MFATFAVEIFHRVVIFFEHVYSIKFIIDTVQFNGPFSQVVIYIAMVASGVAIAIALEGLAGRRTTP